MRRFAELCDALETAATPDAQVDALAAYFDALPPDDAAWALQLLAGQRPRRMFAPATLRALAPRASGLPGWLWQASLQASGDVAETLAHVLPPPTQPVARGLAEWIDHHLLPAQALDDEAKAARVARWLGELDSAGRWLLLKLLDGSLRVAVTRSQLHQALARPTGLAPSLIAERMAEQFDARHRLDAGTRVARFEALRAPAGPGAGAPGQPYPFFLARTMQGDDAAPADRLGARESWLAEWMVDGLRVQIVRRAGRCWIWSRGDELVTDRFPDLVAHAAGLPDGTVLDGDLVAWDAASARPAPQAALQLRLARKTVGRQLQTDVPVRVLAFDLLEHGGQDLRPWPLHRRRAALQALLRGGPFEPTREIQAADWPALAAQRALGRAQGAIGLMLRHRDSTYGAGCSQAQAGWWQWALEPLRADAVLVYAQPGQGRGIGADRAYSFAVWSRPPRDVAEAQAVIDAIARREPARPGALQLVTVARAEADPMDDAQRRRLDEVVRATLLDKFGPVRSVLPSLVVELGFEGVAPSPRHKSGIALRQARMLRLREAVPLHEAATLDALQLHLRPPP